MAPPIGIKLRPLRNASRVMFTPSSPREGSQVPPITMTSPVIVQITMVSIKVPVMHTSPWRTGSLVLAAAAAMGAEPSPASLLKIPRAMPFCMAIKIDPTTPPVTAAGLKAARTIVSTAVEIWEKFRSRTVMQASM